MPRLAPVTTAVIVPPLAFLWWPLRGPARSLVHPPRVDAEKLRTRSGSPSVKLSSSGASPRTARFARRSTAKMRPAASESAGDLVRQQDVAPRRMRRGAPSSERSAGPSRAGGRRTTKGVSMKYYVGLDWAAREHAVCVVDERG